MAVTWKVVSYDGTKTVGSLSDVLKWILPLVLKPKKL